MNSKRKNIVQLPAIIPSEYQEQAALVDYLTYKGYLYFAIPNGGSRNKIEGARLKRTGVKAGVPDLMIPMPSGQYHGLFIEIKRIKKSTLSLAQRQWLEKLQVQGYKAVSCKGAEDAINVVNNYFSPLKKEIK